MEFVPQRVTFAALATWPVSTAALPSVNTLEETPMFSGPFTCDVVILRLTESDRNGSNWFEAIKRQVATAKDPGMKC